MYRNKEILEHARGKACQNCWKQDGTTVAAHSNLLEHGKGRGIKAHDCFVAYLCHECHTDYDTGSLSQGIFNRAMTRTRQIAIDAGLIDNQTVADVYFGKYSKVVQRDA